MSAIAVNCRALHKRSNIFNKLNITVSGIIVAHHLLLPASSFATCSLEDFVRRVAEEEGASSPAAPSVRHTVPFNAGIGEYIVAVSRDGSYAHSGHIRAIDLDTGTFALSNYRRIPLTDDNTAVQRHSGLIDVAFSDIHPRSVMITANNYTQNGTRMQYAGILETPTPGSNPGELRILEPIRMERPAGPSPNPPSVTRAPARAREGGGLNERSIVLHQADMGPQRLAGGTQNTPRVVAAVPTPARPRPTPPDVRIASPQPTRSPALQTVVLTEPPRAPLGLPTATATPTHTHTPTPTPHNALAGITEHLARENARIAALPEAERRAEIARRADRGPEYPLYNSVRLADGRLAMHTERVGRDVFDFESHLRSTMGSRPDGRPFSPDLMRSASEMYLGRVLFRSLGSPEPGLYRFTVNSGGEDLNFFSLNGWISGGRLLRSPTAFGEGTPEQNLRTNFNAAHRDLALPTSETPGRRTDNIETKVYIDFPRSSIEETRASVSAIINVLANFQYSQIKFPAGVHNMTRGDACVVHFHHPLEAAAFAREMALIFPSLTPPATTFTYNIPNSRVSVGVDPPGGRHAPSWRQLVTGRIYDLTLQHQRSGSRVPLEQFIREGLRNTPRQPINPDDLLPASDSNPNSAGRYADIMRRALQWMTPENTPLRSNLGRAAAEAH